MTIRNISTPPEAASYTPLQQHQEQTPTTFFGAKPVLYAHYTDFTLVASPSQLEEEASFAHFGTEREGDDVLIKNVEIWVTSEDLVLFQRIPTPTGVSISYPSIGLHATLKYKSIVEALYMSLSLNDADTVNEEDEIRVLELSVLPPCYNAAEPDTSCIKYIFDAMNTCADLHPDPNESGEDMGEEEDEGALGASGWITAENMDQYVDEDGNFRGLVIGEELGPGAGTVRHRDEGSEGVNGTNGVDGHGEKWHRIG